MYTVNRLLTSPYNIKMFCKNPSNIFLVQNFGNFLKLIINFKTFGNIVQWVKNCYSPVESKFKSKLVSLYGRPAKEDGWWTLYNWFENARKLNTPHPKSIHHGLKFWHFLTLRKLFGSTQRSKLHSLVSSSNN